ncbi:hypothetical protein HanIR_Chr15g0778011 [Helianthus annuus]|nr:hypothetical protein HanIR_Chr15g0778011 [Helianthus annuus]
MILNGIYNSFFFFFILYVESYLFSKHNIFFTFFSPCALFLKSPRFFCALRLGSGRSRCASPAPCVFDNIGLKDMLTCHVIFNTIEVKSTPQGLYNDKTSLLKNINNQKITTAEKNC